MSLTTDQQVVFVIDDDESLSESLCGLLESLGMNAFGFNSASQYLEFSKPDIPGCVLLDIELPDINGLDFQTQLSAERHPPVVFISGYGDIASSVRAIKAGAVDFLVKPFGVRELVCAIQAAVDQDKAQRQERAQLEILHRRLRSLTPREREVLPLVVSGLLNKQAAAELGISRVTLQIHRGKIMQKMQAASFADLVRIADRLHIPITHSRHRREIAPELTSLETMASDCRRRLSDRSEPGGKLLAKSAQH